MPSISTIEKKEELDRLVSNLPENVQSVLLQNIRAKIKMGTTELSAPITSAFISDNSVVLLNEKTMSQESFAKELEKKGNMNVITFLPLEEEQEESRNLCLISTTEGLRREIVNRVDNGDDVCTFYPKIKGYIDLYHLTEEGQKEKIGRQKLQGVLDFGNRMILFSKPISYKNLFRALWEEEIYMELDWSVNLPFHESYDAGQK